MCVGGTFNFWRTADTEGRVLVQESYCDHGEEASISIRNGLCEFGNARIGALMKNAFRIWAPQHSCGSGVPRQSGKIMTVLH